MRQLTCQQCREADRIAIDELGIPSIQLMENAGIGCADVIRAFRLNTEVVVLCGPGNNGGDGFVIARALLEADYRVTTLVLTSIESYSGDSLINLKRLTALNALIVELQRDVSVSEIESHFSSICPDSPGCIVDAMLGTGSKGPLRKPFDRVVEAANRQNSIRVAVDLPTGIDGDTGEVHNDAFRADLTCTFIAMKPAMATFRGRAYCGEIRLIDIGIPAAVFARLGETTQNSCDSY